jgi:hypothetical protein
MSRAGIETTSGESVGQSGDKRLLERFAATEAVTTDLFLIEVDFAPHEPMRPEWIDSQHMAEHFYSSRFAGPAQVNDASRRPALPIKLKVVGEGENRGQASILDRRKPFPEGEREIRSSRISPRPAF